ncbi:MAG TPA: dTMP kinase [Acidimicrobiales bacterium]|nr:dTMP kinase [Acidimicrobiales bacterium]
MVFEGGEGSGKSTQAAILAARLGAVLTREPGGTVTGERLRSLLLNLSPDSIADRTEVLLMLAARAQHVAEVIQPALSEGRDVVCDRFSGSTVAYQGYGRGLDPKELDDLSRWASNGLEPDRVVLLVTSADVAEARRTGRATSDRIESAGALFFSRVEEGYRAQASADPRWRIVDGAGTVEEVAERVWDAVRDDS